MILPQWVHLSWRTGCNPQLLCLGPHGCIIIFLDENGKYVIFCCAMVISKKYYRHMCIRKRRRLAAWQGKWNQEMKAVNTLSRARQGLVPQYLSKESRAGLGMVDRFKSEFRSLDSHNTQQKVKQGRWVSKSGSGAGLVKITRLRHSPVVTRLFWDRVRNGSVRWDPGSAQYNLWTGMAVTEMEL